VAQDQHAALQTGQAYVKSQRERGKADTDIRAKLKAAGWTDKHLEELWAACAEPPPISADQCPALARKLVPDDGFELATKEAWQRWRNQVDDFIRRGGTPALDALQHLIINFSGRGGQSSQYRAELPAVMASAGGEQARPHLYLLATHLPTGGEFEWFRREAAKALAGLQISASSLHDACRRANVAQAEALLAAQPELANARLANGSTPLHIAAEQGWPYTVELLLAHGADANAVDEGHIPPLMIAAHCGHTAAAAALLAHGANVGGDPRADPPLLHAAFQGHGETAQLLLAHGANPSRGNKHAVTPLHVAADKNHVGVVKLLIAAGADVNAQDVRGVTPLSAARECGHGEIVEMLRAAGAIG
jgi:ankyrin repeat protein